VGKYVWKDGIPAISTFSIVARDGKTDELGIAVQSKFLAVGAAVPWAAADAGAIATQSWANTSYGPQGLAALRSGQSAQDVLDILVSNDSDRSFRQVGIVDRNGGSATYTGDQCFSWAGGRHGENFACQGNILAGEEVVNALADTYVQEVDLPFAERLLAALAAGQAAGGDRRGMQSAAILVVKPDGGYGGFNDRYIDLRVDDHASPIAELARVLSLHRLYFERPKPEDMIELTESTLDEVRALLVGHGYRPGSGTAYDAVTQKALQAYCMTENFDERWTEAPQIDIAVLNYMRTH
jgi:uncharacterized Ntn-hydrolase superfamily protein